MENNSEKDKETGQKEKITDTADSKHDIALEELTDVPLSQYISTPITIDTMMEAGCHFGHQTHRWCPKMERFIFGEKNGIHIINLEYTLYLWNVTREKIISLMAKGGNALFVGTKRQIRDIVRSAAHICNGFYVDNRWLGGTLTNFSTIRRSIERLSKLEELLEKANDPSSNIVLSKKERLRLQREISKLVASLGGIRDMKTLPSFVFVADIVKDSIAVHEARKLHIPVCGLVDTNADPYSVDFPIPCNDDAKKSVALFSYAVAKAVLEGKQIFEERWRSGEIQEGGAEGAHADRSRGRSGRKVAVPQVEHKGRKARDKTEDNTVDEATAEKAEANSGTVP